MKMDLSTSFLFTLLIVHLQPVMAQKDSSAVKPKWGVEASYTGMSYTESAVAGFQITYTTKHHAVGFGPHILHHDLFKGQSDWARFGAALTYSYFPIRSNRLFSPFLFYDLNYAFTRSSRQVLVTTDDGLATYSAIREVVDNALAHHFGIGTRCNFYRGLYLSLSLGGGVDTFGDIVKLRSLQSAYPDRKTSEHPFSHYEPALMFRIGIAYQVGVDKLRKNGRCCN